MTSKLVLTAEQLDGWKRDGFLVIKASEFWAAPVVDALERIRAATDEMDAWPETPGKWMKYFETSKKDGSRILQRIEYFMEHQADMGALFNNDSRLCDVAAQLFGEPAVLYKEKVNFKHPGGSGFSPHQDHAAGWWMHGHTLHISALVGVDTHTDENGRLEVVAGKHTQGLLGDEFKEVPQTLVDEFAWIPLDIALGDVVLFDSYVPHRSGPNKTDKPRAALYLTYNKKSEGDARERYYADKRKSFPPDCERDPGKTYEYKI